MPSFASNALALLVTALTVTAASVEAGKKTLVQKAGSEFSIPLPCGFFLGQNPVPLSGQTGVRGVNIQINLSPDSNIFFDDGTTGGTVDVTGAYFTARNCAGESSTLASSSHGPCLAARRLASPRG